VEAGREVGGVGGSREGVGKTDGLGEGEQDSDIEERERWEVRRKSRARSGCKCSGGEEESDKLSCALPGPPEPLRMSFILPLFFHQLTLSLSHWYSYCSLAALIILSLAYSRFRGLFGQDNRNMSLTVKWGRERFVHFIPCRPPTRLALPCSFPLPHTPHSPSPLHHLLIHAYTASRFPFHHSIPNSPHSDRLFQITLTLPLMPSNSSMPEPS
jgi:hypothetical protein